MSADNGAVSWTAVVAPMAEELAALARRLRGAPLPPLGKRPPFTVLGGGRIGHRRVLLAVTGDGREHARTGLEALLRRLPVERVVAVGVAGALSPDLAALEVVAARAVVDPAGRRWPAPEPPAPGLRSGLAVTAPELVLTAAAKGELYHRLASPDTAVVDLESSVYATVAETARVPWSVLRAVSDTATEELPGFLNACRDAGGAVRRGRVALRALAAPRSIPRLVALHRRVQDCSTRLAAAVVALLSPPPPESDTPPEGP
jgi:nucleoside phosphorylase